MKINLRSEKCSAYPFLKNYIIFYYMYMYIIFTVIIVTFVGMDMYGALHVITQKDFVKIMIKLLDDYLNLAREQSKKHGQIANQLTVIFDMEGFNLKQYLWKPGKNINKFFLRHCVIFFLLLFYRCSWRARHHPHSNV